MGRIIEVVFLVGEKMKEMKRIWPNETSQKFRFFLPLKRGETSGLNAQKAQIEILKGGEKTGKKFPAFYFFSVDNPEEVLKIRRRIDVSSDKIATIFSRQDSRAVQAILSEKKSGRYHYNDQFGWVVVFKGNLNSQGVNEFAGKFFREEMLHNLRSRYEDDQALSIARKKCELYKVRMSYRQNH